MLLSPAPPAAPQHSSQLSPFASLQLLSPSVRNPTPIICNLFTYFFQPWNTSKAVSETLTQYPCKRSTSQNTGLLYISSLFLFILGLAVSSQMIIFHGYLRQHCSCSTKLACDGRVGLQSCGPPIKNKEM